MGRYLTSEEVDQEYLNAMGPELGRFYGLLSNDCQALYVDWAEYKVLFGTNPEQIDLLNEAAPEFFGRLQDTLMERVLLQVARLMDPIKSGGKGKENATLRRLPQMVVPVIKSKIEDLLRMAEIKCKPSRDWRTRRIAHTDLDLAMKGSARPLDPVSRSSVGSALEAIAAVLNEVESHYRDGGTVGYGCFHSPLGAIALLDVLKDGVGARNAEMQRMMSGQLLPGAPPLA
jgi:hypothetical protein